MTNFGINMDLIRNLIAISQIYKRVPMLTRRRVGVCQLVWLNKGLDGLSRSRLVIETSTPHPCALQEMSSLSTRWYYRMDCTICFSSGKTSSPNHSFFLRQILFLGDGCGRGKYSGRYSLKFRTVSVSVGLAAFPK